MSRVCFLEDDGLRRIVPWLRDRGHEAVVVRTGAYDRWHVDETLRLRDQGLELEVRRLEPGAPAEAVRDAVDSFDPDALVSLALLEPECLLHAEVGDAFRSRTGRPAVVSPVDAVRLGVDKDATKRVASSVDVPVVEAVRAESLDEAERAAERLGLPMVSKRLDSYTGRGMRYFPDREALASFFRRRPAALLLEPFVDGVEVSVEVLRWNGVTRPLGLVYKGRTDPDLRNHPMYRLRLAPYSPNGASDGAMELLELAARAVEGLGLVGAAECDFVLDPAHGPRLFEINPRLSGTTPLTTAVTGVDQHLALARMALGEWPASAADRPAGDRERASGAQMPVYGRLDDALEARLAACDGVSFVKRIDWMPSLGLGGAVTLHASGPAELEARMAAIGALIDIGDACSALRALSDHIVHPSSSNALEVSHVD